MRRGPRGIVLIDLLILLVTLALLLAVGVPELSAARRRSVQAQIRDDLRKLAAAQSSYFYDHHVYSADLEQLRSAGFRSSPGVHLVVNEATQTGWSATGFHPEWPAGCFLFVRGAAPVGSATTPGVIGCD
jgi:competence protein ComGC